MLTRTRAFGFGALLLVLSLVLASPSLSTAQEGATPMAGAAVHSHPAHIHTGTCDDIGEVVYPLADVAPRAGAEATPMAATPMMEATAAMEDMGGGIQAEVSVTMVETTLADLLDGEYLINVHESAEAIDQYIACGEITGTPDAENSVYIGLRELNNSGYSGVAWLRDNEDGTTYVTIFLAEGLHGADMMGEATPEEATPEMGTPEAATPEMATPAA